MSDTFVPVPAEEPTVRYLAYRGRLIHDQVLPYLDRLASVETVEPKQPPPFEEPKQQR